MSDETPTPLDTLKAAINQYANTISTHGPVLVDISLVIWEEVLYDEDGDVARSINYATPSDTFSLSSALGLIEAARTLAHNEMLGE